MKLIIQSIWHLKNKNLNRFFLSLLSLKKLNQNFYEQN